MKPLLIAALTLVFCSGAYAQYKPTPGEQRLLRDAEIRQAEQDRKIMAGMDRDTIIRMYGQPNTVNLSRRNDGATDEQMVYRVKLNCGGKFDEYTMYVYLTADKVTSSTEHARCSR